MDRGTQLAHPCFDTIKRESDNDYIYRGRKREKIYNTHTYNSICNII